MKERLADLSEILFRQIHPHFIQDGQICSPAFCPTPKDNNLLSVDRGSLTTAQAARHLFVTNGGKSDAVYALSVEEFEQERLACHSDPIEESDGVVENLSHAVADFSVCSAQEQKKKAKRLKLKAIARGPQPF
jgi:hypothetical protein